MIRSMKRSMISTMIKSMVNPDSGDSEITRYFAQLDNVLMSHYVYANTLVFQAGDTFKTDFLAPTSVVTGSDDYITDGDDANNRGSFALLQDGTYLLGVGIASATVDGVAVTGATNYPTDGKLHKVILTLNAGAKIKVLGARYSLAHFYSGILANPVATISGVTTSNALGLATGNVEASVTTGPANSITYVNIPDSNREQYTLIDGSWFGENLWLTGDVLADGSEGGQFSIIQESGSDVVVDAFYQLAYQQAVTFGKLQLLCGNTGSSFTAPSSGDEDYMQQATLNSNLRVRNLESNSIGTFTGITVKRKIEIA